MEEGLLGEKGGVQEVVERPKKKERIVAVDYARGFTIVWMIMVDNQGDLSGMGSLAAFTESPWVGLSAADTVFPSFLFLLGVSVALALQGAAERYAKGGMGWWAGSGCHGCCSRVRWEEETGEGVSLWRKAWAWWSYLVPDVWGNAIGRSVRLFVVGMVLNAWDSKSVVHFSVMGVLQRLGVAYFFLSLTLLASGGSMHAARALAIVSLLAWLLLYLVFPIDCGQGSLTPTCNAGRTLDHFILGTWGTASSGGTIAEGLGSTPTAIFTAYVGLECGALLRSMKDSPAKLAFFWFAIGILTLGIGAIIAATAIPCIKKLWTPSFAFIVSGTSTFHLLLWLLLADMLPPFLLRRIPLFQQAPAPHDIQSPSPPPLSPSPLFQHLSTLASIITAPLIWLGRNPAVVFVGMVALEILLMSTLSVKGESAWTWLFQQTAFSWDHDRKSASSVFATYSLILWTAIAGVLHWRKIYIKF